MGLKAKLDRDLRLGEAHWIMRRDRAIAKTLEARAELWDSLNFLGLFVAPLGVVVTIVMFFKFLRWAW